MFLFFKKSPRFIILFILLLGSLINQSIAQVSNAYSFTQSLRTFTPITGGTILGTPNNNDVSFNSSTLGVPFGASATGIGFPIGFPFIYNGQTYDNFGVNSNGWIRLDTGVFSISNSYNPINPISFFQNFKQVICAFASDLQGKAGIGELSYGLEGVSPNQTLVVQWLNYAKFSSSSNTLDTLNFQIRLNESLNTIDFVYGSAVNVPSAFGTSQFQVGINGSVISDYLNRETITDWTNTVSGTTAGAFCTLTTSIAPPSGLTFTYGILSGDIDPPVIANDTISPLASCPSVSHTVTANILDASGIASAEILWNKDGVSQPSISMSNVGSLYSGTIPASGSSTIVYNIRAIDAGVNSIIANELGGTYQDNYLSISTGTDKLISAGNAVQLIASSPFLTSFKISEVTFSPFGSGAQTAWPSYITNRDDNIELINLSSSPLDISGFTLNYIDQFLPNPQTITFPLGTIVPSDSLAIVHIGTGTDDFVNRLFNIQNVFGPFTGQNFGVYINDAAGNVIDAVAFNNFTFPAFTGVSSSDFSGSGAVSLSGFAGPSLVGSDLNSNSNWVSSSAIDTTSMGSKNVGIVTSVTPTVTWSGGVLAGIVTANMVTTPAHPISGTYTYVASITDGICISTDTVLVNVIAPTVPDAEFSVDTTVGNTGGIITVLSFSDLSTNFPSAWSWTFIPNTVTFLNGTSSSSQNPVVTFDSAAVYTVTLLASNSVGSNLETKPNFITITVAYCISAATNTADDDIGNVTFGTLNNGVDTVLAVNNPTAINTYSDFTSLTPSDFAIGSTNAFSAIQINSASAYFCNLSVYIDYNQDGLLDTTEGTFIGTSIVTSSFPATFINRTFLGNITIPTTALLGNTRMRVVLVESDPTTPCGTYLWGETEDYTINITPPLSDDASILEIDTPNSGCSLSAAEIIRVQVSNSGSNTITNLPVSYTINGGTPITEIIAGTIPPLTTIIYTFSATANLSASGNYLINAFTSLVGDATPSNDNKIKIITSDPLVSTFPYIQDFSTAQSWKSISLIGSEDWSLEPNIQFFPPLLPVFGSGIAFFEDNSFSFPSPVSQYGYTCGFNFTTLTAPRIELFVLQENFASTTSDYIAIDVSTDNGLTYITVDSIFKNNASFANPGWGKFEISLAAFAGQSNVLVALRGVLDFFGSVAVDRFRIFDPAPQDAGVISVDSLKSGCGFSSTSQVYVTIKNFGTLPISSTQVSFRVDSGTVITETANLFIEVDSTVVYLFTATADLSFAGNHTIDAWTTLMLDPDQANDTSSITFEAFAIPATPIVNNSSVCSGAPALLTASGSSTTFNWYDAPVGGNFLFSGPSFSVSPTIPTTYYVEGTDVVSVKVGASNNAFGPGGQNSLFTDGLVFNAINDVVIDSVVVYPESEGLVFVEIKDTAGNVIGTSNPTVIDITQIGARVSVPVNIIVKAGVDYLMSANGSTVTGLFRNTGSANYPFPAPRLVTITGPSNGLFGFYYFFYNWSISNTNCPSARAAAQVSINTAPIVNLGPNNSFCAESTPLLLDAGNIGSTYLWSTGATTQTISVTLGGTYSVTITAINGCTATDAITLTAISKPIINLGNDAALCGAPTKVLNAGNPGSTYLWSTGATTSSITIAAAGTYSVLVTNSAGCFASDTIVIKVGTVAVSTFTTLQILITHEVNFIPASVFGSHSWDFGQAGATSNSPTPAYNYGAAGSYQVTHTFTNSDGCMSTTTQTVIVDKTIGFAEQFFSAFSYQVYPNPMQNETRITYELKERSAVQVNVFDVLGRKIVEAVNATQNIGKHEFTINKEMFNAGSGIYQIQLMVNGKSETIRLVKAE